jgi:hypothetical protein
MNLAILFNYLKTLAFFHNQPNHHTNLRIKLLFWHDNFYTIFNNNYPNDCVLILQFTNFIDLTIILLLKIGEVTFKEFN